MCSIWKFYHLLHKCFFNSKSASIYRKSYTKKDCFLLLILLLSQKSHHTLFCSITKRLTSCSSGNSQIYDKQSLGKGFSISEIYNTFWNFEFASIFWTSHTWAALYNTAVFILSQLKCWMNDFFFKESSIFYQQNSREFTNCYRKLYKKTKRV